MNNVLDIARYIINYSNNNNYGISNLKLQKILYFVQAYFLTNSTTNKPCFGETIEAWDFGPVVPKAYQEYKQYGSGDIPTIKSYIDFDEDTIWDSQCVQYDDSDIDAKSKELINAVVDKFSFYSATDLVTLTHKQSPWKDVYVPYSNNTITNEAIRKYFNG
ncbi:MAG: DUF4065 domain-containing protein [Clostridia bacterium]|nr:DUF4065 domain-containing protein [Clostridia bacterium]